MHPYTAWEHPANITGLAAKDPDDRCVAFLPPRWGGGLLGCSSSQGRAALALGYHIKPLRGYLHITPKGGETVSEGGETVSGTVSCLDGGFGLCL